MAQLFEAREFDLKQCIELLPLLVRIKNFLSPSHLAVEEECLLCLPLDEIMKYPLDSLCVCVCVPPPSALERKKRKEERVGG